MEVLELPERRPRYNVSVVRAPPVFDLYGLEAGTSYQVNLYAVNAKGRSEPYRMEPITFKGVAKFTGPSEPLPMNPVLAGLVAAAGGLGVVVCAVAVALFRRHQHRRRRADKHTALEAVLADDTTDPHSATPGGAVGDDADPDVIPNKYERRPLKGFMKMYKTPPHRRRKKDADADNQANVVKEELNHRHLGEDLHNKVGTLRPKKAAPDTGLESPAPLHKLSSELVTSSHLLQESCI